MAKINIDTLLISYKTLKRSCPSKGKVHHLSKSLFSKNVLRVPHHHFFQLIGILRNSEKGVVNNLFKKMIN